MSSKTTLAITSVEITTAKTKTMAITSTNTSKGYIVIPYMQGLSERIKDICGRYSILTCFKGNRLLKNISVSPKDKDPMGQKVELFFATGPKHEIVMNST